MAKTRKILIWGGTGAGIFVALLAALVLVLPRVLNTESIEHSIASALETRYHVRTERVAIAILPYPRLILHGARMTVPEVLTANAEQVSVSPKLLPLLTGKIVPASVAMLAPRVVARLPEQSTSNQSEAAIHHRFTRVRDKLAQVQGTILAAMPGGVFDINEGSLEIYSGQDRVFWFQKIDLRSSIHARGIEFELATGKSDLWDTFTFNGRLDPNTWKSFGQINLTGGTPLDAIRYFLPAASQRISDTQVDLNLNIAADGPGNIRADFNATVPQLTLADGPEKTVIQNGSFAGSLIADSEGVNVSLTRFRLDHPRLSIIGRYVEKYADQSCGIDLEGRDTDATSVRQAILAWDKDSQVVRKIFEIIREGEVPIITFSAHTNKASELKKLENFTIKGRIEKGTIFPPKAELFVKDARGDVTVSNGILEAMNLYGKTAGTTTSDGSLRIGLRGGDAPFHLDLPLDADLSELPDVLNRVVDSEAFKHELTLIKDVKGRARGRLLLGESLKDVKVKVETDQFQLSGRYDRIAEPLELSGASFLLEGSKVSGTGLAGKSGRTKFTDLTASYDWKDGKNLQFSTSVMAVVSLDLLNPVINWPENWQKAMNGSLPKGVLVFDSLDFKGPIPDRSKWVFKAGGTIEEVTFHSNRLTGPVKLNSGTFDLTDNDVHLKEVGATLSDSSVTVSGTLKGWFENLHSADLTFGGQLGPKGNRDIAGIVGLPGALRAISNLVVSSSHMVWKKDQSTVFDGEMQVSSGPRVTIGKVERTQTELSIEDLAIKDPDSDALVSIKSSEGQIDVKFSGTLSNRTVDKLLTENKMLSGPIQGKFNARLLLDSPKKSTAQGQVRISGFQLPMNLNVPARIENATLEANGNRIDVKSAVISWNGSRLSLGGNITIAEAAYNVDMNAFADDLNLESLLKSKEESKGDGTDLVEKVERKPPGKAWNAPIRGIIRVRSERLTYGKLTWNPANADLVLSPGLIDVRINQANLCGISTVGKIAITRDGLKLAITPKSRDQDLEPALSCIFNKQHLLSGKFDMNGNLTASANGGKLADTLEGDIDFTAKHGRIYRYDTFAKIISMLSITEIYRGVLPDLFTEGCAYDKITVKGKIKNGKLTLTESVVDGPCVKMVFRGDVDFAKKKMDVVALVTPLRTVDRIVGAVPVIGKLLDGAFFSVPVSVSGDISDPAVIPMSPTAVGEELFGFMKRTFRLPLTILQPLAEGQGSQAQGNQDQNSTPNAGTEDRLNDH